MLAFFAMSSKATVDQFGQVGERKRLIYFFSLLLSDG